METELVSLLTAAFTPVTFRRLSKSLPFHGSRRHAWRGVAGCYVLAATALPV